MTMSKKQVLHAPLWGALTEYPARDYMVATSACGLPAGDLPNMARESESPTCERCLKAIVAAIRTPVPHRTERQRWIVATEVSGKN